jgi:SecD/SecF fusion protein
MRSFFWKFVICLLPCALAAWVTTVASINYANGDSGGFKLGVDLVGGTILVYEIDLRKGQDADKKDFEPLKDISVLAETLKRRIDPNDLYNITIRPAGGEGRIEIILPTGGTHRTKKAEENWKTLLDHMKTIFLKDEPEPVKESLQVGRGKTLDLADQIQVIRSEKLWKDKLFSTKEGWKRLQDKALADWAIIEEDDTRDPDGKLVLGPKHKKLLELPVGDVKGFERFIIDDALANTKYAITSKVMKSWLKKQAWEEMMTLGRDNEWVLYKLTDPALASLAEAKVPADVVKKLDPLKNKSFSKDAFDKELKSKLDDKEFGSYHAAIESKALWKYLEPYKDEMDRIDPDSDDQLVSFVLCKGSVIGEAGLTLIKPLVGENLNRIFDDGPSADEVRKFIDQYYGPSAHKITDEINKFVRESKQGRDLSVEEVQRIKDLVSKVGSLEFRILANQDDDKKGEEDAKKLIDKDSPNMNPEMDQELKKRAAEGLPPPGPREGTGSQAVPKRYEIATKGAPSYVSYSWVELGPQERRSLNLDNAARTDSSRNHAWLYAASNRYKAIEIPEVAGNKERMLLRGALFYSRKCVDRNLPADERAKKEIEYFVLTRDPEFKSMTSDEPLKDRPKIDGSYLVRARSDKGADLRPTVNFEFNPRGGELFGNITRKNVSDASGPENTQKRRHLAIILDGLVMSAPTINSEIRTNGQISGNFTKKEVDSLVNILNAGKLPATLKPQPVSESTIAATLGQDTIEDGVKAIFYAFLAVLAFMVFYYRFAGIVASIALMANLLLTVGFMVAVQATFTLSGLAGIVLTLGMAVDANVLIYERLREERERGASLLQAIRNGYDRALPTIIDTHLSSIFTAIVLYVVGNDNLKGFAISMTVGLLISLFTSLFMTRLFFDFWQVKGWLTKLTMLRLFGKPNIDFMSIRNVMFVLTLGLAILGVGLFVGRLPNDLNIDFVGGTAYGGKLRTGVLINELRNFVSEKRQDEILKGVQVKETEPGRRYQLIYPNGDPAPREVSLNNPPEGDTPEKRIEDLRNRAEKLPDPSVELLYNSSTDPAIVKEMDEGRSRNFTIRTTEKEPDLVQVQLDQLLRKDKEPLLKKVFARADKLDANREAHLAFYEVDPSTVKDKTELDKLRATASPSFVKTLLNRDLREEFGLKDEKTPLPFYFEVNGEGNSDLDGKFPVIKVSFDQLKTEDMEKVQKALDKTQQDVAARPLPDRLENFDSALATETRFRAMWAILASWAAILMYLWFRFGSWTFGLAAVICLIHDLFFTIGAIALCHFVHTWPFFGSVLLLEDFKIDLPSVAALLTLVGYSVNDTIVVFDRIREVRGKNPDLTAKMINDSINQTLSRTILSSLTVWLVVVVLYFFGGPGVHLFAFVMVVGVIVGTYSSIYIASPLLLMFGEGKHEESPQGAKLPAPQPASAPV